MYNAFEFALRSEFEQRIQSLIGSTITVKQPYLKHSVDGHRSVRIDNALFNVEGVFETADSVPSRFAHKTATFVHSKVAMAFIDESKGRGIVATQNIDADAVILREPAMVWTHTQTLSNRRLFAVDASTESERVFLYNDALHDLRFAVQRIARFGCAFDKYSLSMLFHENIDRRALSAMVTDLNAFRHRNATDSFSVSDSEALSLSVSECASLINCNAFKCVNDDALSRAETAPSALFVVASLFNHSQSVEKNVRRAYVWEGEEGDAHRYPICEMRTTRSVRTGEELCQDYGYDPVRARKNW